ncbi:hypothetical protein L7F22_064612 [Adiantum nelumboides]|nr:hypothetical protein [Adiantum nelumboides]
MQTRCVPGTEEIVLLGGIEEGKTGHELVQAQARKWFQGHYCAKGFEFKVKDTSQADFGRLEIKLAKVEMPELMPCHTEFGLSQPLKGDRITGYLCMTTQTTVLIETLKALGAMVCWCSCNIFSTQDHVAIVIACDSATVFAWKRENLQEYWWCTKKALEWTQEVPHNEGQAGGCFRRDHPGVHKLYQMQANGTLLFLAINVNDSVTKSKFDNLYGCRHSLPNGLMRATDAMLAGKVVVVCGYGNVGKGCATTMKAVGSHLVVTEINPICALQATMEGLPVLTLDDVVERADIFVTTIGNKDIIMVSHIRRMKNNAVVCNNGELDNEIDMLGLETYPGVMKITIKPQTDHWVFPKTKTKKQNLQPSS